MSYQQKPFTHQIASAVLLGLGFGVGAIYGYLGYPYTKMESTEFYMLLIVWGIEIIVIAVSFAAFWSLVFGIDEENSRKLRKYALISSALMFFARIALVPFLDKGQFNNFIGLSVTVLIWLPLIIKHGKKMDNLPEQWELEDR